MKSKTFGRKLTLNKKTIADLDGSQMKNAYGGIDCTVHRTNCTLCHTDCTCEYTGVCCTNGCPTECTCGTGDPLCPCVSKTVE
jgi:hypothetical protein